MLNISSFATRNYNNDIITITVFLHNLTPVIPVAFQATKKKHHTKSIMNMLASAEKRTKLIKSQN